MNREFLIALVCAGAVALAGCGMDTTPTPSPQPDDTTEDTGLAVTLDVDDTADVDAIRFDIDTCAGEEVVTETVSLSEIRFDEELELDVESDESVPFADYFATLEPGCYDVEIVAVDDDGEPVDRCMSAVAEEVEVTAGETTEIAMVSQCGGDQQGGLDVLGVLNFAPTISMLQFDPSKVVGCDSL